MAELGHVQADLNIPVPEPVVVNHGGGDDTVSCCGSIRFQHIQYVGLLVFLKFILAFSSLALLAMNIGKAKIQNCLLGTTYGTGSIFAEVSLSMPNLFIFL